MKVHAIVGTGSAPARVIAEGLRDGIGKEDAVSLVWTGRPTAGMEMVYDFVLDNDISFQMFYADGTTPPRVFRESEFGAVQKVRDPFISALKSVALGGNAFFLWDEEKDDAQIMPVFDTVEQGVLVLELTNGLAPISMDMEIPEPVEREVEKDEAEPQDDTQFTKEELEVMTAFAVKRYGERLGTKATTKGGIIEELFPGSVIIDPRLEKLVVLDEELEKLLDEELTRTHPVYGDVEELKKIISTSMAQITYVLKTLAERVYH
jgi:hypothetical protein